jgi:hypothetical protein
VSLLPSSDTDASSDATSDAGTRTVNSREETGPAVKNGVLRYVSVSQIQTFDPFTFGGCHRKWWFDKVGNFEREETEAQRKGKAIHGEIEHYLKTGEDALSMTARQGKHFFPDRRHYLNKDLLIEHPVGTAKAVHLFDEWRELCAKVDANSCDGADVYEAEEWERYILTPALKHVLVIDRDVPLIGYIDVVNGSGFWTDNEGVEHKDSADIEVIDWKTTSNIAEHAKTPEQLTKSVQMVGYSKWALQVFPDLKKFRVSHGNLQTRGRAAEKRTAIITVDDVNREWQHAVSTVQAMKQVAKEPDVKKVEAYLPSCEAYRGCPYQGHCPKTPEQVLINLFGKVPARMQGKIRQGQEQDSQQQQQQSESKGDTEMGSMADFLLKKATGGGAQASETPGSAEPGKPPQVVHEQPLQQQPAQQKPAPTQAEVAAERAKLEAEATALRAQQTGAAESFGFCAGCGAALSAQNSSRLPTGARVHIACPKAPAQVLPPDAPKSTFASSAEPVPPESFLGLPPEVQARAQAHRDAVAAQATAAAGAVSNMQGATDAIAAGVGQAAGGVQAGAGADTESSGRKCSHCKEPGHTAPKCPKKAAEAAQAQQSLPMQPAVDGQVLATPTKAEVQTAAGVIAEAFAGPTGIELFVDCVVEGVELKSLDRYIDEKNRTLAEAAKLPEGGRDIRFAGPDTALGFMKWKGALTALIKSDLPPPGRYNLMFVAEDELRQCAVAALKPHCSVYVRGVR